MLERDAAMASNNLNVRVGIHDVETGIAEIALETNHSRFFAIVDWGPCKHNMWVHEEERTACAEERGPESWVFDGGKR